MPQASPHIIHPIETHTKPCVVSDQEILLHCTIALRIYFFLPKQYFSIYTQKIPVPLQSQLIYSSLCQDLPLSNKIFFYCISVFANIPVSPMRLWLFQVISPIRAPTGPGTVRYIVKTSMKICWESRILYHRAHRINFYRPSIMIHNCWLLYLLNFLVLSNSVFLSCRLTRHPVWNGTVLLHSVPFIMGQPPILPVLSSASNPGECWPRYFCVCGLRTLSDRLLSHPGLPFQLPRHLPFQVFTLTFVADGNSQHWCGNNLNSLLNSPVWIMPVKTNPTEKKNVAHADATRDVRKVFPSWTQVFPASGPSPSGPWLTGAEQSGSPVSKSSRASQPISSPPGR